MAQDVVHSRLGAAESRPGCCGIEKNIFPTPRESKLGYLAYNPSLFSLNYPCTARNKEVPG
jgi:hypothetical protein